jgi:peptidoglycan-N-acetylglucosamine deacetylase
VYAASDVDPLASISVDLDPIKHYCRIHGLPESMLSDQVSELVATKAIPRFLELFKAAGCPATFFVVGEELGSSTLSQVLLAAHGQGVELANHSYAHDYGLSRSSFEAICDDLERAEQAIIACCGVRPVGFRAPGYTLSGALMRAVVARGYAYDSSTYPAAPYYLAKAAVLGALSLLGRPSRAMLDSPKVLLAPVVPYRPSLEEPYQRGDAPLVELPLAVAPVSRVPFIGTFATTMPWPVVEATFKSLRRVSHFNFELHAVDVLDESDGLPPVLARQQRDLKVPVRVKLERLARLFAWLGDDRQRVTVAEAAVRFAPLV